MIAAPFPLDRIEQGKITNEYRQVKCAHVRIARYVACNLVQVKYSFTVTIALIYVSSIPVEFQGCNYIFNRRVATKYAFNINSRGRIRYREDRYHLATSDMYNHAVINKLSMRTYYNIYNINCRLNLLDQCRCRNQNTQFHKISRHDF